MGEKGKRVQGGSQVEVCRRLDRNTCDTLEKQSGTKRPTKLQTCYWQSACSVHTTGVIPLFPKKIANYTTALQIVCIRRKLLALFPNRIPNYKQLYVATAVAVQFQFGNAGLETVLTDWLTSGE
ncbi:hypothetical protein BaRGS_00022177 [Batillaria attramentaria]|uniref:Uncharacterized protein n=1 Tax=Batillaria attramentaria TaxID=370345 RepID=A0ABD0KHG6_9CAEN